MVICLDGAWEQSHILFPAGIFESMIFPLQMVVEMITVSSLKGTTHGMTRINMCKLGFDESTLKKENTPTLPETNIAPENQWSEGVFPIEIIPFWGDMLVLQRRQGLFFAKKKGSRKAHRLMGNDFQRHWRCSTLHQLKC